MGWVLSVYICFYIVLLVYSSLQSSWYDFSVDILNSKFFGDEWKKNNIQTTKYSLWGSGRILMF